MQGTEKDTQVIHPWVAEGLQKVRVGVSFLGSGADWKEFYDNAQAAEELGYDSIWVPDHPTIAPDCWTLLAALAVTTRNLRLGSFVACVFFRHPLLLAREAADVDRWSGGRLVLGLGIGDIPFEFEQLGIPFLKTPERQAALAETIEVLKGIWDAPPLTYTGKYVQTRQAQIPFGPVQQPYVPLLIGGGGERTTLRQVAQYADASNFGPHMYTGSATSMEDVKRKCSVLRTHCEAVGRPVDAVLRTHTALPVILGETPDIIAAKQETMPTEMREFFRTGMVTGSVDEIIAYYSALVQAGIQYFIIGIIPGDLETLQVFSQQVMPALS